MNATATPAGSPGDAAPDANVKWIKFARRILLVLLGSVALVGAGLTLMATARVRDLIEESLERRGRTIANAVSSAAFVPVMLEDTAAAEDLAARSFRVEELLYLRIEDPSGRILAERSRTPMPPDEKIFAMRHPVLPERTIGLSEEHASNPVGFVHLGIDRGEIDAAIYREVARNLAWGAALVGIVFLPAHFMIRGMILRMESMVGEVRLAEALKRSNEELESFAYVASHDLQEPLRMVASYTALLAEKYRGRLDADADEYISFAVDGANRMKQLITDLLSYSRLRTRSSPFVPIDLNELVGDALKDLRGALTESGGVVTFSDLPRITGDWLHLRQVFQNLIGNALKYHGADPPRISISSRRRENEFVIAVADNGIGVEPRHAERIFLPFQRLHTRREYSGNGIGLAIVRKIVDQHQGRVWVESDGKSGSTFFVALPAGGEGGGRSW